MTRRVKLDGTAFRYTEHTVSTTDADARPPVLLLHPWFGCQLMWEPLASRLDVSSYAVDWYSLADTGVLHSSWAPWASPTALMDAAVAMLDERGLTQVDVIGNSVGGIVAQLLAVEHSERVRRLILIGTGAALGGPPTAFGALVGRWIDEPDERPILAGQLVDALVAVPHPDDARERYVEAVLAADPDFLAAVLVAARGTDLRGRLREITAPTLVIRGQHDTARTREHIAELVAGIRDARAVELPGLGHSPMVEDPDAVADLVLTHLRE